MNTHEFFNFEVDDERGSGQALPDADRLPKVPLNARHDWHMQKRAEAMRVLMKCCEIWEEADRIGLGAVREKMEPAIMHAHDAFVQIQVPTRCIKKTNQTAIPQSQNRDYPLNNTAFSRDAMPI
jgi:hypothetical protein